MNTKILFVISAVVMLLLLTEWALAQPSIPVGPAQAPLDGGLGFLAAAGGAYAVKKLRDKKRNGNELE